ncbi:MAG: aldo/keto reductase, partial [Flavisolibacter sp.]
VRSVSGKERSGAQTALQFVLQQPAVTSAVVGIRTMLQIEEAVAAITAPPLASAEMHALQNTIPANRYKDHR